MTKADQALTLDPPLLSHRDSDRSRSAEITRDDAVWVERTPSGGYVAWVALFCWSLLSNSLNVFHVVEYLAPVRYGERPLAIELWVDTVGASRLVAINDSRFPSVNQVTSTSGAPRSSIITDIRDNVRDGVDAKFYRIVPGGLREDAPAYVDREHQWNGDRQKEGRVPALVHDQRNNEQHERDERQHKPVDAAQREPDHLRGGCGLEPHATIQHPADGEGEGDDRELDPCGPRLERGRDARKIDRCQHARSLPESVTPPWRRDVCYDARVSTSA